MRTTIKDYVINRAAMTAQKPENQINKNQIVIYKTPKGPQIQVKLENETIWLDAHQIASIFGVNRPAIVKHINNIYKTGELYEKSTCSILEQVAADGKIRKMNLYNLDMVISVGYRVNSKKATQFRIWATKTLKEYLVKGYAINENRILIAKDKLHQLQEAISFLQNKANSKLLAGQEKEILALLSDYSKTLSILEQYDTDSVIAKKDGKGKYILSYDEVLSVIDSIKQDLSAKKQIGDRFGIEFNGKLKAIMGAIYQTFGGESLYASIEEKAAHLLYLLIKDHPFADGNKRIASFLFIYFLDKNNYLFRTSGERKINDNALAALALLIAISDPKEKEKMTSLITNLISD